MWIDPVILTEAPADPSPEFAREIALEGAGCSDGQRRGGAVHRSPQRRRLGTALSASPKPHENDTQRARQRSSAPAAQEAATPRRLTSAASLLALAHAKVAHAAHRASRSHSPMCPLLPASSLEGPQLAFKRHFCSGVNGGE